MIISRHASSRRARRLSLEPLEDRSVPAAFEPLGSPGGPYSSVNVISVSADGKTVLGTAWDGSPGFSDSFLWTSDVGWEPVPYGFQPTNDYDGLTPVRLSADGSTIVGTRSTLDQSETYNTNYRSGLYQWSEEGGLQLLGSPQGAMDAMAFGASADGETLVGLAATEHPEIEPGYLLQDQAIIWTEGAGFSTFSHGTQRPTLLDSSDNGIVIGTTTLDGSAYDGFYRDAGGNVTLLPRVGSDYAFPRAISADGSAIVGDLTQTGWYAPSRPFRWTSESGITDLGVLPDDFSQAHAFRISADGQLVGGQASNFSEARAVVWREDWGLRFLADVLTDEYGLEEELAGWKLTEIAAISDDGSVLVGHGYNPQGQYESWRVNLSTDIKMLDATTADFRKIVVRYEVSGGDIDADFTFKVYLSDEPRFDPKKTLPEKGKLLIDKEKDKKVGDDHTKTIALDAAVPPLKAQRQYLIVVADANEDIEEDGESEEEPIGENNSMFVIPILKTGNMGFDLATGVYKKGIAERNASGPITGRISRGTADFDRLESFTADWNGPGRGFKDEEPEEYLGDPNDPQGLEADDHYVDPALLAPIRVLTQLIDLATEQERFSDRDKSKLPNTLLITDAFDEQGEHYHGPHVNSSSTHYEGRGIDIAGDTEHGDPLNARALHKILGLGILAGFTWAYNEANHAHFSMPGFHANVSADNITKGIAHMRTRGLITTDQRANLLTASIAEFQRLTDLVKGGTLTGKALKQAKAKRLAEYANFRKIVNTGIKLGEVINKKLESSKDYDPQDAFAGDWLLFNAKKLLNKP